MTIKESKNVPQAQVGTIKETKELQTQVEKNYSRSGKLIHYDCQRNPLDLFCLTKPFFPQLSFLF